MILDLLAGQVTSSQDWTSLGEMTAVVQHRLTFCSSVCVVLGFVRERYQLFQTDEMKMWAAGRTAAGTGSSRLSRVGRNLLQPHGYSQHKADRGYV